MKRIAEKPAPADGAALAVIRCIKNKKTFNLALEPIAARWAAPAQLFVRQ